MGNYLTTTSTEMYSSSHELSAPVADNVYIKKYTQKLPYVKNVNGSRLKYPTDRKSAWFWSYLEISLCTDELWYNETVCV